MQRAIYTQPGAAEIESVFDSLHAESKARAGDGRILDGATDVCKAAVTDSKLPESVQKLVDLVPDDDKHKVLDSVVYGMEVYRREHGHLPTADLMAAAIQQGYSAAHTLDKNGNMTLDSVGSSHHHDQISAQPNRIVVAITSAIAEAVPFATYLPTDIGSNEARLGIASHIAGSAFGAYAVDEIMDGTNVGKQYLASSRRIALTLAGDRLSAAGQITTLTSGGSAVGLLRGRTMVFVNGFFAAAEAPNASGSAATSPISGTITIGGTDYTVGGTINVTNGTFAVTFNPALPSGSIVHGEGFIDYEAQPTLTPELLTRVQTYSLFASPWRATARQTVDSRTQYQNELGLDLQSETLIAVRNQFANERHYDSINKAVALGKNHTATFNFAWTTQGVEKTRAQIWQDFMSVIGAVDQKMAEDTMDHGISHIYVRAKVAAQLQSLPSTLWESSGLRARPGIYRLGRLFGLYDVYYVPTGRTDLAAEGASTSQILCVGRSQQVARCPLVLGDAVAPTYLPLAMGQDMRYGNAFYARNFTSVNPHQPSARGCALIDVTDL